MPRLLANGGIGCERTDHGAQARTIAIYTRVVAERVCVLDYAGRCHPRSDSRSTSATIRLPRSRSAPSVDLFRQELGRRGILARIARPRGPKMYASLGDVGQSDGPLTIELGEIGFSEGGDVAHVMVRVSGTLDADDWPGSPGGELVRLARTRSDGDDALSRRMTSPLRACWRLERGSSSALAD
ncbi:MAG: hypothetical protein ACT4PJ_02475 [Gemmatimonadaceae bacterium]